MKNDSLFWLDATAQAELIRSSDMSVGELLQATIERIQFYNPKINAIVKTLFDEAKYQVSLMQDGPVGLFSGVPFAFKDLSSSQQGLPNYMGNKALKAIDYRTPEDSHLGARFRNAGLITLGTTHSPEFGNQTSNSNEAHGVCRNPWNPTYSCAGSSSGAAAAVASGLLPMAHGSDGGGSLRLPAAWCGVVGLKPSRGRTPSAPRNIINRRPAEFAITRSIRDAAALLDAVHGALPSDLYQIALPQRSYLEELHQMPTGLRIGVMTQGTDGAPFDEECRIGLEHTINCLEALGHHVEDSCPKALCESRVDMYSNLGNVVIQQDLHHLQSLLGRPLTSDDVEPFHWQLGEYGRLRGYAFEWVQAQIDDQRWSSAVLEWWQDGFDLLLSPTIAFTAWKSPEYREPLSIEDMLKETRAITNLTRPFNLTGQPAISLPLHETKDGMPVGMQFVANMGREDILIQIAAQLEQAMPWERRHPNLKNLETFPDVMPGSLSEKQL